MLRVDNRLAGVIVSRLSRRGEVLLARLGGHDEHFSAGRGDFGQETGEGGEVGHAEGAPVAAEVWVCVDVSLGVSSRRFVGEIGGERRVLGET